MNQSRQILEDLGRGVSTDDKSLLQDVLNTLRDMGGKVKKKGATKAVVELDGKQIGIGASSVRTGGDWVISISATRDWSVSNRRDVKSVKYNPEKGSIADAVERSLKTLRDMK